MIRNAMIALSAAALALVFAGQATALTLINRDKVEQRVQVIEGGDDAVIHEVVVAADQTLDELCEETCTIVLQNGEQETFDVGELVYIENGRFVIGE